MLVLRSICWVSRMSYVYYILHAYFFFFVGLKEQVMNAHCGEGTTWWAKSHQWVVLKVAVDVCFIWLPNLTCYPGLASLSLHFILHYESYYYPVLLVCVFFSISYNNIGCSVTYFYLFLSLVYIFKWFFKSWPTYFI